MITIRRFSTRVALWLAVVWAIAYYLGRTWGSTRQERTRRLPGDGLVPNPAMVGDHAITINATPDDVWPWLAQMGWHRGGWYTYRWVDRLLFPQNPASAERILPEFQELHVGDRIPDGPPERGCFFVVEELRAGHHLVLRSTTHLPPQLVNKKGVSMNWTWAFVIEPEGEARTRFHFRWRGEARPLWLRLIYQALVMPADFVMGRSMCLGLKKRVEASRGRSTSEPATVRRA
ncbi:MAG TPA: hypothetical protein VFB08_17585 [Burkholderiales bacterium]|nr:hypothetical protein [Burkholderiales bacterium]